MPETTGERTRAESPSPPVPQSPAPHARHGRGVDYWMRRLLPPEAIALVVVLLVPVAATIQRPMEDPDLFWHLEAGQWIVQHHAIPYVDPFSFIAGGRPWIAYSWLSEILFWALYSGLGFNWLLYLQAALVVVMALFIYLACRRTGARPEVALAVMLVSLVATGGHWAPRPQVIAFALLAAQIYALLSPALRRHLVWIGPLLVVLWANVHITFVIGVGLFVLAAICARLEGTSPRPFALAAATSAAASLVNPYGWRLIVHLRAIAQDARLYPQISELAPIPFGSILGLAVMAFLFSGLIVLGLSRARITWWEAMSFLGSLAVALLAVKNVPIFVVIAAPTIARHAEGLFPNRPLAAESGGTLRGVTDRLIVVAAIVALVVLAPRDRSWRPYAERGGFPVRATDYIEAHHPGARLFSEFHWAGFCLFRSFPGVRVAIDGRTQFYGPDLMIPYLRTHFLAAGWEQFLEQARPELILWPTDSPLTRMLRLRREWKVVYEDEQAILFAAAAP